jgi:hypothetical protein
VRGVLLMGVVAAVVGFSCGTVVPPTSPCCTPVRVARDFGYVGSFTSDAGITTDVQLIVNSSGQATVSFVRRGDQIVQTFTAR